MKLIKPVLKIGTLNSATITISPLHHDKWARWRLHPPFIAPGQNFRHLMPTFEPHRVPAALAIINCVSHGGQSCARCEAEEKWFGLDLLNDIGSGSLPSGENRSAAFRDDAGQCLMCMARLQAVVQAKLGQSHGMTMALAQPKIFEKPKPSVHWPTWS